MDGLPSVPTQVLPLLQSESEVALARIKSVPQGWVSVIRCLAVVSANILLAGGSEWRELDDLEVPWSVQGSKHGPWNHQYNMFNLKMALNSLNFFPLFKVKEWRIGRFVSINSTCFFLWRRQSEDQLFAPLHWVLAQLEMNEQRSFNATLCL